MTTDTPLILLYNPQVAKPGYHRLPHSLLQLGTLLEGRYPYEIIDGNLDQERDRAGEIIDRVRRDGVRYLGVTIMPGPQLQRAAPDIRRIKAACPNLTIIVGGYFPTNHPNTCANDPAIDYVVLSAGEDTLPALLDTLEQGGDPATVAGLAFARDGQVIHTLPRQPHHPNDLPWYPYHKVPVDRYVNRTHLGTRTLSHHSSFGCPFFCNFCAVVNLAEGKWLPESAERLGELTQYFVDNWHINALEFHDNNFFTSEKRVAAYAEDLLRRDLLLAWWGEGRIDTMLKYSDRTWKLMRDSGLKMVFMGAESADDETLRKMNKGGTLTADKTLALAARARQYDIVPEFSFILGNPPDPHKDIERGIEFIRKVKEINPAVEIIMYRYDPVPLAGEMWLAAEASGFAFPQTLDEWADPKWVRVQLRRSADTPWFKRSERELMRNFETVLNAYYPTTTDRRLHSPLWRPILKALSGWRYNLRVYRWPFELEAVQRRIRYQRPETSGF
ncbi:B12-binding domain-containing radical SAM protein [Candidatus Amarolinea aalborgensis]|uniref:B12-binding domain-containing radical SAM protein n=1 Tax=Candidatus Amarolinea aalborgensis TaxID=2249329 RepID=UPI003BF96C75